MLSWLNGQNKIIVTGKGGSTDTENDDCVLMQFTGLKDKNGKEIYEGDIVQFRVGENLSEIFTGDIYWFENEAEFDIRHPEGYHGHYSFKRDFIEVFSIEIIGNIYENSDLLKG